jgi:hypothetical protein
MYDNQAGIAASSHAASAPSAEDQGLYDEPAFKAATDKENPVYESTDNLAAPADDGVALVNHDEAANEDGGYLDVNAE